MKRYTKPAIEIIAIETESELLKSSKDPDPNTLYYFDGYSTESDEEDDKNTDGDWLIDDM